MEFTTRFELQSQATRLVESAPCARRAGTGTGLSPSLMLFSKRLRPRRRLATPLQTTIPTSRPGLQHELFPLHSPLLGESWLVSSPPLSYMLKFSGSSCLIGGMASSMSLNTFSLHEHFTRPTTSARPPTSPSDPSCPRPAIGGTVNNGSPKGPRRSPAS